jgi:hypothetical protein
MRSKVRLLSLSLTLIFLFPSIADKAFSQCALTAARKESSVACQVRALTGTVSLGSGSISPLPGSRPQKYRCACGQANCTFSLVMSNLPGCFDPSYPVKCGTLASCGTMTVTTPIVDSNTVGLKLVNNQEECTRYCSVQARTTCQNHKPVIPDNKRERIECGSQEKTNSPTSRPNQDSRTN